MKTRFGIGEWYGRSFVKLTPEERQEYAELQFMKKKDRPEQPCRPRMRGADEFIPCTKTGGVCTLRQYQHNEETGRVAVAPEQKGTLRTTCPYRFEETGIAFEWIGETLLGHSAPSVVNEMGFLRPDSEEERQSRFVGNIDGILVHPDADPVKWCALEVQSVYFSGTSMRSEFRMLRDADEPLPFPAGYRRPDYRSSGPKRKAPRRFRREAGKLALLQGSIPLLKVEVAFVIETILVARLALTSVLVEAALMHASTVGRTVIAPAHTFVADDTLARILVGNPFVFH